MNESSKIYIPGHNGLLGNALIKRLKEKGYKNLITKDREELDLTDRNSVDSFFNSNKPEIVIIAAGKTGGIIANKTYPADFLSQNIGIQNNLFEMAIKHNVSKVVFYGSSCVYPKLSLQPIKEEYLFNGYIEETSDAYASAKIAGIIGCKAYNVQYPNAKFICLIPNSMYGPFDNFDLNNSHVLSALIRKIHDAKINNSKEIILWGSGNPKREFVFSEDVAEASIFAIQNSDKIKNTHYNVGSSVDISIKELANLISKIIGYPGEIQWDTSKPDGTLQKLLDSSKFLELGWRPITSLENGIKATYDWFKNTGVWGQSSR